MTIPDNSLGTAIKTARLEKKLTQEKLAELLDITPTHMKQLESGRRNPSIEVLYKLVPTLNLSLDSVFSTPNDDTLELRNKINLCLNRCDEHELSVVYATVEALIKI